MGDVEVHALRGVEVDLFESEFVVILGPSGSGKSTLLNILGGLDVPTSCTVAYKCGRREYGASRHRAGRRPDRLHTFEREAAAAT